jgi:hypothetical protein
MSKVRRLFLILLLGALIGLLILILIGGYAFGWNRTGFGEYRTPLLQNISVERPKTLWDWLDLLIIPVTLAIVVYFLNRSERSTDRKIASENAQLQREIAIDNQFETRMQSYFDKMSDLLLANSLRNSTIDDEVIAVAQTRTLSILRAVDAERQVLILRFLKVSKLIDVDNPIIKLSKVNISRADLRHLNFDHANFVDLKMENCNLIDKTLKYGILLE